MAQANDPTADAIHDVKAGDLDAYQPVVLAYQRRLRALAASWAAPGIDPDEVAHMAFIEAYKRIDSFEEGTDFFAWLSAFARNILRAELTRLRRQARNRSSWLAHLVARTVTDRVESASDLEESRLEALRTCLDRLDRRARSLLEMRYREDNPLRRIADTTGRTESSVRFRLFAIRKGLRECIRTRLAGAS